MFYYCVTIVLCIEYHGVHLEEFLLDHIRYAYISNTFHQYLLPILPGQVAT
jgi:hypothetical protein